MNKISNLFKGDKVVWMIFMAGSFHVPYGCIPPRGGWGRSFSACFRRILFDPAILTFTTVAAALLANHGILTQNRQGLLQHGAQIRLDGEIQKGLQFLLGQKLQIHG